MANATFQTIPTGSQFSQSIGADDPEDLNDFSVLVIFNENVTGLTLDDFTLTAALENVTRADYSDSVQLLTLAGENSVYLLKIRPPAPQSIYYWGRSTAHRQHSVILTLTLRANAVDQRNPVQRTRIRVSKRFPDADAETPTRLFSHSLQRATGLTATPNEIVIKHAQQLHRYSHTGTFLGTRDLGREYGEGLDYINGDYLLRGKNNVGIKRIRGSDFAEVRGYNFVQETTRFIHTRLGVLLVATRSANFLVQPYDSRDHPSDAPIEYSRLPDSGAIAHQNDFLYTEDHLYVINENDEISHVKSLNTGLSTRTRAIYQDRWFGLTSAEVHSVDIRKYRPVAINTKTTIYPVFADAGDRIDLKQFSPDAERIVFDVGYNKPPFLSINSRNELVTTAAAETCVVKLKAINRIDATETGRFGFYLIIRQARSPVWRDVSELTMRAGSRYDLFQLVSDATSIEFRAGAGFPRPAGSRLSNGVFTVGSVGGDTHFTARNGTGVSHIEITIDVVQGIGGGNPAHSAEVFRYRVEIAGRDVTPDLLGFPSVSETLDPVVINEYRVNEASIDLRNEQGKYNNATPGNFWETHGLNAGGFQNTVKIYTEHQDSRGNWIENLLFSGVINESFEPMGKATFKLNCVDISSRLRKARVQDFGTLEKWDALRKESDEDTYEGTYLPERTLVPMQVGTGEARSDRTDLDISRLELPSEGLAPENTGYMTPTAFRTAGGFLEENPVLRFKTAHRSEDVRFLMNQLAINKEVYNIEVDIPGVEVADPFLLSRGSVAFSVEPTRTTRLPVDWVHDATNDRLLILLSNPEQHISDLLVQYDMDTDAYRVLHTFDKGVAVHRIARRSATHFYILISDTSSQDGSKPPGSQRKTSDGQSFRWDAAAHGSNIRIHHYNAATRTLTEHVGRNNNFPPQLGIHYYVGFENGIYTDEFEGIAPLYRGAFKWVGSHLYYRYAKAGEFGVARVNASGTTERLLRDTAVGKWNHLNFAFDVTSTGTVYMASCESVDALKVAEGRGAGGLIDGTVLNNLSSLKRPTRLKIVTGGYLATLGTIISVAITGTDADGKTFTNGSYRGTVQGAYTQEKYQTITSVRTRSRYHTTGTYEIFTDFGDLYNLVIKRRTSNGTITTLLSETLDIDSNKVFLGVHETLFHNNQLYLLVVEAHLNTDNTDTLFVDVRTSATMALYRCNVTAANPTLTRIDTWDFVSRGACNLTVHAGRVHFSEHSPAQTLFKPINPDL